jgi:glycosyltransferase involved in cell wall biosynthesis
VQARTAGIIAAHNHESFVYSALASLAVQADEVIVVDDASKDNTWKEIARACSDHPNIRSFRNATQLGVSDSVNQAISQSEAEIFFFSGSDDESIPGRVEHQSGILLNPAIAITGSLPVVINSLGLTMSLSEAPEFQLPNNDSENLAKLFFDGNFICAPSVAMRRSTWLELGGYRDGLPNLQDYDLWLRAGLLGQIVIEAEPVVRYRKHSDNLSGSKLRISSKDMQLRNEEENSILWNFLEILSLEQIRALLGSRLSSGMKLDGLTKLELVSAIHTAHPRMRTRSKSN